MLQSIAFGGDIPERVFVDDALAAIRNRSIDRELGPS